jgi:hypothetical protein
VDSGPKYTVNSNCAGAGKRNLTEEALGEDETAATEIPENFAVFQNYPNPFSANGTFGNPQTEIRFQLPEAGRVSVTIFNTLGETVRTLADKDFAAGTHTVRWNARDDRGTKVPSGMYFYQLATQHFSETKRMILAK